MKHQDLFDKLATVHEECSAIEDGRERAIVVRYIEDAMCRLSAAPLPTSAQKNVAAPDLRIVPVGRGQITRVPEGVSVEHDGKGRLTVKDHFGPGQLTVRGESAAGGRIAWLELE
jgi:hypothetical protein